MVAHLIGTGNDRKWENDFSEECPTREDYGLAVLLVRSEYVFFLDGVGKLRLPSKVAALAEAGLQVSHGPASCDRVRLRKKE